MTAPGTIADDPTPNNPVTVETEAEVQRLANWYAATDLRAIRQNMLTRVWARRHDWRTHLRSTLNRGALDFAVRLRRAEKHALEAVQ